MSKILKLFPKGAEKRIDHPHKGRLVHVPTHNNRRYVWATVVEQQGDLIKVECGNMLPWWVTVDVIRDAKPELHKPVIVMKPKKTNIARISAIALILLLPVAAFSADLFEKIRPPQVDPYVNLHTNSAIVGPEAFCFKDGVQMQIYKVVSDLGTNGMGGIQRTWDVWLKCPVCGAKVRDRQTRWVPRPILADTLAHATNSVPKTSLFQQRKNPAKVAAPKQKP